MNVLYNINNREIKKDNKDNEELTGTSLLIYKNLRKNYRDLIDTILGEGYYNLAMDVYTCDDLIADDIKHVYNNLEHDLKIYKKMFKISLVVIFILLIALIYVVIK